MHQHLVVQGGASLWLGASNHRTCCACFMASFEKENDELQNQWMEYWCQNFVDGHTSMKKRMASFCGISYGLSHNLSHNQIVDTAGVSVLLCWVDVSYLRGSPPTFGEKGKATIIPVTSRGEEWSSILYIYIYICIQCMYIFIYWTIMNWHNV